MKRIPVILLLLGLLFFIWSFFQPVLGLTNDLHLNGYQAYAAHIGSLYYVDTTSAYMKWFFLLLTNVWVLFLFVRFWRKDGKKWLTYLIGLLTLGSALYWMFDAQLSKKLLTGYWWWLIGLTLIVLANILQKSDVKAAH